jgi:hypothetical protein
MKQVIDYETIDISDPIESFQSIHSQTDPIDYTLLVNKPTWNGIYFTMDIWSSAWSTGDGTYRDVNLIGANWDMETSYSQEIVVGRWSTTAKITKKYNCIVSGNNITIPWGSTVLVACSFTNATQFWRIVKTWWSLRWIKWSSLDISNTNNDIAFINSSTSESTIKIQFGTSASDRPIFWLSIQIF